MAEQHIRTSAITNLKMTEKCMKPNQKC